MDLSLTFFLFAVPAVLFAGISKGGFGSGAAFAAAPFLALVMDPLTAVAVMLPVLMVIDATVMRPYWRKWSWPHARALIIGGLPGVIIGAVALSFVSADGVRFMIGLIALGFVAFQLASQRGLIPISQRRPSDLNGGFWGMIAGFTSFISHAGGPPAAIYLLSARLDKLAYQATTVIVFSVINAAKLLAYLQIGLMREGTWLASLSLAPVGIAGALIGVWAHMKIPEKLFFQLTYLFLTLTGAKLIFDAIT